MDREQIVDLVKAVLAEILSLPIDQIHLTQDFWDDMVAIEPIQVGELISELEVRTGLLFSDEELEQFASFDATTDLLEAKLTAH